MSHSAPNITGSGIQMDNYMRCWTGYFFWKHYTSWEVGSNDYFQTSDKPIFTIEEVLLNYAEAAFELNRFDQGVADRTINLLRDRGPVATTTPKPTMRFRLSFGRSGARGWSS